MPEVGSSTPVLQGSAQSLQSTSPSAPTESKRQPDPSPVPRTPISPASCPNPEPVASPNRQKATFLPHTTSAPVWKEVSEPPPDDHPRPPPAHPPAFARSQSGAAREEPPAGPVDAEAWHQDHGEGEGAIDWEGRLRTFYAAHCPEKVVGVPGLLERCRGHEALLYDAVVAKYTTPPQKAKEQRVKAAQLRSAVVAVRTALAQRYSSLRNAWSALSPQGCKVPIADVARCFAHVGAGADGATLLRGLPQRHPSSELSRREFFRLLSGSDDGTPPFAGGPCDTYTSPPRHKGRQVSPGTVPPQGGWNQVRDASGRLWFRDPSTAARIAAPAQNSPEGDWLRSCIADAAELEAARGNGRVLRSQSPVATSPPVRPLLDELLEAQRAELVGVIEQERVAHAEEIAALKEENMQLRLALREAEAPAADEHSAKQTPKCPPPTLQALEEQLSQIRSEIKDISVPDFE